MFGFGLLVSMSEHKPSLDTGGVVTLVAASRLGGFYVGSAGKTR